MLICSERQFFPSLLYESPNVRTGDPPGKLLSIDMFEHLFEHGEVSVAPALAPDLASLRAQIRRLEGQETPGDVVGFAVPEALRSAFPSGKRAGSA